MNQIVGAFEAKTHFSEILKRVAKGEEFYITNRGKMVAVITSPEADRKVQAQQAFSKLRELRKKHPIGSPDEIAEWKKEGQK